MGAVPTYVNQGAFTAGTGALSVSVPTGYADGDILVLLVSSANQDIATPGGWLQVTNSPQGTGIAGSAGGIRLAVFWKLVSGSQSSISVADSGSVTAGQMFLCRGVDTAGPINITAGSVNTPASTSWSCPAVTTTISNCLILNCIGQDRDANSTTSLTAASNANLASLTKRADETVNAGAGGGLGLYTGSKVVAGDTGVTSVTSTATTTAAFITIALAPPTIFGAELSEAAGTISDVLGGGLPSYSEVTESAVVVDTIGIPASVEGAPFTLNTTLTSGSTSITVPDAARFVLVFWGCKYTTTTETTFFDSGQYTISIGSKVFSHVQKSAFFNYAYNVNFVCAMMAIPSLGGQTFSWSVNSALTEIGHLFTVIFLSGIDLEAPILATSRSRTSYTYPEDLRTAVEFSDPAGVVVAGFCQQNALADITYSGVQQALVSNFGPDALASLLYLDAGWIRPTGTGYTDFWLADAYYGNGISVSLKSGGNPGVVDASREDTLSISLSLSGQTTPPAAELTEVSNSAEIVNGIVTSEPFAGNILEIMPANVSLIAGISSDRDVVDTLPIRNINGPYVDIPTKMMFSDSRTYQIYDSIYTASGSMSITVHPDTNLMLFVYNTMFSTPAWIQDGNYTLTLNGMPFVHIGNTNATGYNVLVAYIKNPASGTLTWNFPNTNFGTIEAYRDIFKVCQFVDVDISGDPFRSVIDPISMENIASLTLSDISFNEGDMVVGIEYGAGGGLYGELRCDVGMQPNLVTGGVYSNSYGWSIRATVGAIPWGASSITATSPDGSLQNIIYLMALVLKVKLDGWIASPSTAEAGSLTPSDILTSTSFYTEEVDRTDSLAITEAHNGISSATEEADRTDSAAITEIQVGAQSYGGSVADILAINNEQIASRYVYGTGYAWAIVRATQNSHKTADSSVSGTLILSEEIIAWRGLYVSLADIATVEEIVSSYNTASGIIAESMEIDDDSTTIMVSWGFMVETVFVADVPTNTAIMNAARIELFMILDGYSAIRVECYFPEMTVTYGETSYTATLFVPTIEAVFNSETIMGTLQDNEMEAIFSQDEITAVHDTPEIEAIAAGAVVATLSQSTYIATKGE